MATTGKNIKISKFNLDISVNFTELIHDAEEVNPTADGDFDKLT